MKFACLMMIGTLPGVEVGARGIQHLKHTGQLDRVVGPIFAGILGLIAVFMTVEVLATLRSERASSASSKKRDRSAFAGIAKRVQNLPFPPFCETAQVEHPADLIVVDYRRFVRFRRLQRISRGRRRLHPHAVHGLSPRHSDSYRGGNGPL